MAKLATNKPLDVASNNNDMQFKDYQFAKNEIEDKQNEIIQATIQARLKEELSKYKEDIKVEGDLKLKQMEQKHQKDIQLYVRLNFLVSNLIGFDKR